MDGRKTLSSKSLSPKKALIFSVLPVILLLVVAEGSLRVWAYYFRTPYERYNYSTARLELVPDYHVIMSDGREVRINSRGFVGREFDDIKPEGIYRIFALGDSCTFGGNWNEAYPEVLQQLLNSTNLGQRFEVINAGIEGYNSAYALGRLKTDLLRYDPDMVVIYIGWNDLMKINPDNLSETGRYIWLARIMGESYLVKGYSKLIFYYLRPLIMKPRLVGDAEEKNAFEHFVPLTFQENLDAMVRLLHERKMMPVLLTLPTVVKAEMSHEELTRQNVFFPYYAGSYSIDRFLSLHRSYNNVIRLIASQNKVPLVDLDTMFNNQNKNDLFWDTMHPSVLGHRLIAQTVLEKIKELM